MRVRKLLQLERLYCSALQPSQAFEAEDVLTPWGDHSCYPHFIDEKTEAQKGDAQGHELVNGRAGLEPQAVFAGKPRPLTHPPPHPITPQTSSSSTTKGAPTLQYLPSWVRVRQAQASRPGRWGQGSEGLWAS